MRRLKAFTSSMDGSHGYEPRVYYTPTMGYDAGSRERRAQTQVQPHRVYARLIIAHLEAYADAASHWRSSAIHSGSRRFAAAGTAAARGCSGWASRHVISLCRRSLLSISA